MTDRERIEELATAIVCPMNLSPSTPYELGMVKQYTNFALIVIEKLGYTRQDTLKEIEELGLIKGHNHKRGEVKLVSCARCTFEELLKRGEMPEQSGTKGE